MDTKTSYRMLSPIVKVKGKNKTRSFQRKKALLKDKDIKISAKDFVDISAPASDQKRLMKDRKKSYVIKSTSKSNKGDDIATEDGSSAGTYGDNCDIQKFFKSMRRYKRSFLKTTR